VTRPIAALAAAARWGSVNRLLLGALCALTLVALASALTGSAGTWTLTASIAISNPDRRVAERNLDRDGPVDEHVLRELSADAAPALPAGWSPSPSRTAWSPSTSVAPARATGAEPARGARDPDPAQGVDFVC
jgi:hypothetical protein